MMHLSHTHTSRDALLNEIDFNCIIINTEQNIMSRAMSLYFLETCFSSPITELCPANTVQCLFGPAYNATIWSLRLLTLYDMIVLFKCNPEVLPLSYLNIYDNGRHTVTNERALWARTPQPVRPLSHTKRSTSFYIFVLFSKEMRTKTRMLIRRIRRVLRDAGRNMEGATLNLLKRTNTAGKDGTEQKWPSASLKRHT